MGVNGDKPVARHPDRIFSLVIAFSRAFDNNSIHSERGIRCDEIREIVRVSIVARRFSAENTPTSSG
jgi:hypothetical protein